MEPVPEIRVDEAKRQFDEQRCVFVDVRDAASYGAAHIPGASHLHGGNVEEFVRDTGKETPLIVYCYHGNSSIGAAAYLREQGFLHALSMSGGFEAWRQIYPCESAAP
jgi:thiosulfate sulfurtransferase